MLGALMTVSKLDESQHRLPKPPSVASSVSAVVNGALGGRILVAQDPAGRCDEIVRILAPHWSVESIADWKTAYERIVRDPPDIVITELGGAAGKGFDLLRELRRDARATGLPVIVLADCAGDLEGKTPPADDCVVGPFSPQELVARVKTQLELSRLRRISSRSETQLRLITDAMPALISYVDPRHRYVFHNKAYEVWFGLTGEELRGRHIRELLGEAVYAHIRPHLERALLGHRETFEVEVPYRTGGSRFVEARYVPDIGSDGIVAGVFVLVLDMTERKKAEMALRQSEDHLRLAIEAGELGTYEFLAESGELRWSGRTKELFALPSGRKVDYETFISLVHPDDRTRVDRECREAIAGTRNPVTCLYRTDPDHDGSVRYLFSHGRAYSDETGRLIRIVGTVRDVTALHLAEEEARRLNETLERRVRERTLELESALGELEMFSYTVAHDLRAPLRAVSYFALMLSEDHLKHDDGPGQDYARKLRESVRRMDTMVQDLLSYSRLAREQLVLEPIDLGALVGDVVRAMAPELLERKGEVSVEGKLPVVRAHRATLAQALTNLIGNAAKFVVTGRDPRVRIRAERSPKAVLLWVEDNGIGIAPEYHERIWGVFERLHHSSEYPGTGIGLAIVRKVMERIGGRAGVESELGKGSRFWLEFREGQEDRS
jgi:PAS domain S-box-containing protein